MPDELKAAATPPAPSGGPPSSLTREDALKLVSDAVGEALKTGLSESVKALVTEQLTAQQTAAATAAQETAAKEAAQKAADAARAEAVKTHLAGVPAAYHGQLGSDPAKWADDAAAIRTQFQADLAAAGIKATPVTTANPGGGAGPTAGLDLSKLGGHELIALACKTGPAPQPMAAAAAAAAKGDQGK